MWYLSQENNPDKHILMPSGYPWKVSESPVTGWTEITGEDYVVLLSLFDLTAYEEATAISSNWKKQHEQRLFGEYLVPEMIDLMGQRNLDLAEVGTVVDINAVASANAGVKLLIETGALKTARSACEYYKTLYLNYTDIYQHVIDDITEFLIERGY